MAAKPKSSEVHAYGFILEDLREKGWDTRNPNRSEKGQVWTQNECLQNPTIKTALVADRPENIVKVSETAVWVIEAKPRHNQIELALTEAIEYATKINKQKGSFKALFVSGVAGNPADSYLVKTQLLSGKTFEPITLNGRDISSLITPEIAKQTLESGNVIKDIAIDESLFLAKAEKINQYLHEGAVNKSQRAKIMAALLLSLVDDTPPNIEARPTVLINDINSRAESILRQHNKPNFFSYIKIALPPTEENHVKFKRALVRTIQELNNLNIRSAMNSGTDVLGKFYEVFLKYGNGAKEIGIVLTPRHITEFAIEVLGVTDRDVVYDPTCGTGGFLVAAFDSVKRNYSTAQVNRFKENNLFGVEQDTDVVSLAIVNMIFRGDGKNGIMEGNCFHKNLERGANGGGRYADKPPTDEAALAVTRVFMNPPFALKGSDEEEYRFVNHALAQMVNGGLLFAVLPYSTLVKPGGYQSWRKDVLLKNNTLVGAITFPPDLFYPVGVHTVGLIVRKGVPHPPKQPALWIRAIRDGLDKSKGKRLPRLGAENDYLRIKNIVKAFVANPDFEIQNIEQFQKAAVIDLEDPLWEMVPENYLDQKPPTSKEMRSGIEDVLRDSIAFMVSANSRNQ